MLEVPVSDPPFPDVYLQMNMVAKVVRPPEEVAQKSPHLPVLDVMVPPERRLVACGVEHPLSTLAELVSVRDSHQGACAEPAIG